MKQTILLILFVSFSAVIFAQTIDEQLVQAAYDGDVANVEYFLNQGANPNSIDANGYTALIYASAYGYQDIMKKLIAKKASSKSMYNNVSPLFAAVNNDNPTSIQILLDAGALINKTDTEGYTPLMYAAQEGYLSSARYLLEKGASVNIESEIGHTALSIAIQNDHEDIVELLLQYNPKKKGYSHYAHSPLNTAIHLSKNKSEKLLKEYGMNKKLGSPSFEYISVGAGVSVSPYDLLVDYRAGIHETIYNFDVFFSYSYEPKKITIDMNTSPTIYGATKKLYFSLNKNFNLFSINKGRLGISFGGFVASYYGYNSLNTSKTQILYGINPGLYYRVSVFTVSLKYNHILSKNSVFYTQGITGSVAMKFFTFPKSKTKFTYSDKTLMNI